MYILIMRHGDAINAAMDYERTLSRLGEEEVRRSALAIKAKDVVVDQILSSPLPRAMQTADIVSKVGYPEVDVEVCGDLAPGSQCDDIAQKLHLEQVSARLLVCHQPFAGRMVQYLTQEDIPMGTGMVACIKMNSINQYSGELEWVVPDLHVLYV